MKLTAEKTEIPSGAVPSFVSANASTSTIKSDPTSEVLDLTVEDISEPVGDELDAYLCLSCGTPANCSGGAVLSITSTTSTDYNTRSCHS